MPLLPFPSNRPSPYETGALEEIRAWRIPKGGLLEDAYGRMSKVIDQATDKLRGVPGVDWTLDTFVAGIVENLNHLAHDLVAIETIYAAQSQDGPRISAPGEIHAVDLRRVDTSVAALRGRYATIAGAEGAATGFAGAPGIVPDIIALTTLNLQATGEYATWYGFDVSLEEERLFALTVLSAAAGSTDLNKDLALRPISRASQGVAKQQVLESAGQYAITGSMKKIAEKLGIRLTKAKLAQMLPIAGAVVGGSLNVMFTNRVCATARNLYRERFLLAKYGPDVLSA